ncbi:glycosyltransferase family 1 protein [Vibrio sp. 03-59-1]|uniref:glycosyltransferase family protein n=1 Tax=Vibrio sp. 03-59-1 TaxID=2607607 RepID=UPI0014937A1F|nr:glycosyltransferase [Vibrio sp. 03-59-1]NOH84530.1 glycosyltransferase family 1 protein [Vibrio sp. 03-59-1]
MKLAVNGKPLVLNNGLLGKIAVVRMWPDLQTAEDEVIARISNTCDLLGLELSIVDTAGCLVNYPHSKITSNDVDFVIHLHFETPKTYDAFSFVTLWNPLDFYHEWGYRKYSTNLMTHDDFLSCGSESADDHIKRQIVASNSHLEPDLTLFHSLPEPYYEPNLGDKKLFYVGINWERLGKGVGRHDGLLKALDATGDLAIYGPKIFHGVDVWEGYSSYVGPIPFDGTSAIKAIHKAGISLVLSSEAHKKASLMSSRLFESLAAGAVIIVDENAFAKQHFGDTLLYIKTENVAADNVTGQVRKHLDWINDNPDEAIALAKSAQKIFKEKFDMSKSVENIYSSLPGRKKELEKKCLSKANSNVVNVFGLLLKYNKENLHKIISNFNKQSYESKKLLIVIDSEEYRVFNSEINSLISFDTIKVVTVDLYKRNEKNVIVNENTFGTVFYPLLANLNETELFSLLPPNETLFCNHYSSLVRAFEDDEGLELAHSDVLFKHKHEEKQFFDLSIDITPFNNEYNNPMGMSRLLFKMNAKPWLHHTLKYMNWGLIDTLVYKSEKVKRVSRASCTVDIQQLLYPNLENFELDAELLMDGMLQEERTEFLVSRYGNKSTSQAVLRSQNLLSNNKKIKFNTYSIEERQEIIAHLLESLTLPSWLLSIVRKGHSMLTKRK